MAGALNERADGLVDLSDRPTPAALPVPKLLGPFDPMLHGWVPRGFLLGPHQRSVVSGGLFRSFALADGQAVATWGLSAGQVTIRLLQPIAEPVQDQLHEEASRVLRYLGLRVTAPRVLPAGP